MGSKLAIILCTWKRPRLLSLSLQHLMEQSDQNFDLYLWNNNPAIRDDVDQAVAGYRGAVVVHHASVNEGECARYRLASKLRDQYSYFIFLDDDQFLTPDAVASLRQEAGPNRIVGWWAWTIVGTYMERFRSRPGKPCNYINSGCMIAPSSVFTADMTSIPRRYQGAPDLWISHMFRKQGGELVAASARVLIYHGEIDPFRTASAVKEAAMQELKADGFKIEARLRPRYKLEQVAFRLRHLAVHSLIRFVRRVQDPWGFRLAKIVLRPFHGRYTQIVVTGVPRSGTSLLYNMLAASLPQFWAAPMEVMASKLLRKKGDAIGKSPQDLIRFRSLPRFNIWKKRIIIIAILRDPRDVLTSFHPNLPDRYIIDPAARWSPRPHKPTGGRKVIKINREGVISHFRNAAALRRQTAHAAVIVRYEDLVANPNAVQAEIASKTGLEFADNFSEFRRQIDKLPYCYQQPINKQLARETQEVRPSASQRWTKGAARERILKCFKDYPELFEILIEWGYESNCDWYATLKKQDYHNSNALPTGVPTVNPYIPLTGNHDLSLRIENAIR